MDQNNAGFIQQLEKRKKDPNLVLKVNVVGEIESRLTMYLAHDGAENRTINGYVQKVVWSRQGTMDVGYRSGPNQWWF